MIINQFKSASLVYKLIGPSAILLVLIIISACSSPDKLDYKPLSKSLLWEISGQGLKRPSYVFGTIHLIPSDEYFWTDAMQKAFERSEEVVFEIDMNEFGDMSSIMSMLSHLFMKGDTTLKDLISSDEYSLVNAKFQDLGLPLFLFERVKPFFLTVFLSDDMRLGGFSDSGMKSYEIELNQMALQQNKKVSGLETIEFQASIFDKIPYREQAKMLLQALSDNDNNEDDQLNSMIKYYKSQDIEALGLLVSGETGQDLGINEELIVLRNINWIPIMVDKMNSKVVFFAVGAGHLPGKSGILHLMRKKGYKVKPLR